MHVENCCKLESQYGKQQLNQEASSTDDVAAFTAIDTTAEKDITGGSKPPFTGGF
jgi:hypothetical protein